MINIYLVSSQIGNETLYKIGYTRRSVEKRVKEFKTGNASNLEILEIFQSEWGTKVEALLHKKFNSKRINGEWFDLSIDDISNFINTCEKFHNNLTTVSKGTYYQNRGDF